MHIVASPRHADALVVTGPVTVNMERALKDVYKATADPRSSLPWETVPSIAGCSKAVMR